MKEKLTYLWHTRPRMSREMKTVRNLLIIALAMLACWWVDRCPAFTAQGAVDKLSRQLMLPEGEIVEREDCWALVKGEGYAYVTELYGSLFGGVDTSFIEGTKLDWEYALLRCPIEREWAAWEENGENTRTLVCPQGPEPARSCKVTIQQVYEEKDQVRELAFEMSAQREDSGAYLLCRACETAEEWEAARNLWRQSATSDVQKASYVLRFYDEQERLLETQEGEFTFKW